MRSFSSADSAQPMSMSASSSSGPVDSARQAASAALMDSLLHDARNPLNALSINLEVLAERLRRQAESVAPAFEKNLRVMREQILRVDGILRSFADFISPRSGPGEQDFSALVLRALEVLGHECRRRRLTARPMVEAGLRVAADNTSASFCALQALLRGIRRTAEGGELTLTLKQEGTFAVLKVADGQTSSEEPLPEALPALQQLAQGCGGRVEVRSGECVIYLPLA